MEEKGVQEKSEGRFSIASERSPDHQRLGDKIQTEKNQMAHYAKKAAEIHRP